MTGSNLFDQDQLQEWAESVHPLLWSISEAMSEDENWVLDNPEDHIFSSCLMIARAFDEEIKKHGIYIKSQEERMTLIYGLAYLGTCKSLRLLSIVGQSQPGLGYEILKTCLDEVSRDSAHKAECNVVASRIKQIVKMDCYSRIFNEERRTELLELLEEDAL